MMDLCTDASVVHQGFWPAKLRGPRCPVPHPLALLTSPLQQRPVGRLKSLFKESFVIRDQREHRGREKRGSGVLQVRPANPVHRVH